MMKKVSLILVGVGLVTTVTFARTYRSNLGIVSDGNTILEWQDNYNNGGKKHLGWFQDNYNNNSEKIAYMNWFKANQYCKKLTLGGYHDWRLPTIKELITIVDYHKHEPAIDKNSFKNVGSNSYWSSTVNKSASNDVWIINFDDGSIYDGNKLLDAYVRCVRNGRYVTTKIKTILHSF